jgi:hypothetical protein
MTKILKVLAFEPGTGMDEIVYWYESLSNERGYSTKVKDISIKKYKEILWDKIENILEIAGYEVDKIKSKLIDASKIMQYIRSIIRIYGLRSRAIWNKGYTCRTRCHQNQFSK